jgi:hypothetical protein
MAADSTIWSKSERGRPEKRGWGCTRDCIPALYRANRAPEEARKRGIERKKG